MDEAALRQKVGQLLAEVHRLPPAEPQAPTGPHQGAGQPTSGVRREMAVLEDSLDQVRLAVKYLVFDLEATKRENELLRQMLGE
jgi:aminoglycoside phosphotransferase (APT) family kinase protein